MPVMRAKSGGYKWGKTGKVFKTRKQAAAYGKRQKAKNPYRYRQDKDMTIDELQEYAISLGVGIGCENENRDLINAIFAGWVQDPVGIVNFKDF